MKYSTHPTTQLINHAAFKATCSEGQIVDTDKCEYKHITIPDKKTLIYWKGSGRISTRKGFVIPE